MPKDLIFASTSAYKQKQFQTLQLTYRAINPNVDELHDDAQTPKDNALRLAAEKSQAAFELNPTSVCIGSDQTGADSNGQLLTKPMTFDHAVQQLLLNSGKNVTFHSAVSIHHPEFQKTWCVDTRVTFRALNEAECIRYINKDNPLDCAGSFKAESLGISLFSKVESNDPSALIGLPLISLANQLRALNLSVP